MSGIHNAVLVSEGPGTFVTYTANVTIAAALPFSDGNYTHGYVRSGWYSPGMGSIASEVGGAADVCITYSASPSYSNPNTTLYVSYASPPAGWDQVASTSVTVGGVTRNDGWVGGGLMAWTWVGDVFSLRSKSGQTIAISIEGVG